LFDVDPEPNLESFWAWIQDPGSKSWIHNNFL